MINLKFMVSGTGRCGTVYMARLLTSLGIMCGHEIFFHTEGLEAAKYRLKHHKDVDTSFTSKIDIPTRIPHPEWFNPNTVCAASSFMAAPFLDDDILQDAKIIHIVRHPLAVISSFALDTDWFVTGANIFETYRKFVFSHIPELKGHSPLETACLYYVKWNRLVQAKSVRSHYARFRVEEQNSPELMDYLGVDHSLASQAFTNSKINSWRKRTRDITLDEIPGGIYKKLLIEMAEEYGYELK